MKTFKYLFLIFMFISSTAYAEIGGGGIYGGGSGGVSVASDCDVAEYRGIGKLCQDSDDGKLYKGTGSSVLEVAAGASTGDVTGPSASTDFEVAVYSSTGGKTLKRSNNFTGLAKLTDGVLSTVSLGTLTNTYICTYSTVNGIQCNTNPTTYGMVYPGAGIAVSTGSAWTTAATYETITGLWTSCTSGYLKYDGTCATPTGGAGTGDMTTDAIWDAKGDLAVGTGANAAAKLAVGTAYQVLHVATDTPGWTSTLGATGTRLTAGFFTDLTVTNAIAGAVTGNAGTATALAANPTDCSEGELATAIDASGNLTCGKAIGTDVQAYNSDLTTLAGGGTANCVWGEKSDASGIECKTTINIQMDDSAAQFKSATASKGTLKFDQTGISDTKLVTVKYTATDSYAFTPTLLGNVSLSLGTTFTDGKYCTYSTANGFTCNADGGGGAGDLKADGSVPMTGALVPNAANTIALGSASAEWEDIYLGDGAVIYGQNDQSNTITSSSTGWTFAKPVTVADVSNDNFLKITNNASRAATSSVNELYPESNVWKANQNGTEYSIAIGPTAGQINFSGTLTNGKYCTYATGGAISCNSDGGGLAADGSVAMTGALVPNAVNTIALGSASAEWADIYLGDSAVIYGENDSSNTITSSATGWAFAKAISATSVSTTAEASTGGYLRLLEGSNNGTDYSMITGIADAGTTAAFTFGGSSTTENVILTIPATTSTEATVTSSSGITSINFSSIQVRDTKVISADTDNEAMTASQMGRIWTNTGDGDGTVFTLPEASTVLGQSVTFAVTVAQNLDVNPNDGTDQIMGLTNATGDAVRCATIGCTLTLTAVTANMWMVTSSYGTWADVN